MQEQRQLRSLTMMFRGRRQQLSGFRQGKQAASRSRTYDIMYWWPSDHVFCPFMLLHISLNTDTQSLYNRTGNSIRRDSSTHSCMVRSAPTRFLLYPYSKTSIQYKMPLAVECHLHDIHQGLIHDVAVNGAFDGCTYATAS